MHATRSRRRFLAEVAVLAAAWSWRAQAEEAVAPALSASDAFAANVTREIVATQPQGNVVVSPYSVQGALALAALGAKGATRDTLQSVAGLADLDPAALRAAFSAPLVQSTRAAFVRRGAIAKSYAQAASQALAADVRALPHDPVQAAGTVDRWADHATHHRIASLVDTVPADVPMLLADAAYLDFRWKYKFEESATHDLPFRRPGQGDVDVPMMKRWLSAQSGACSVGQYVKLPFEGTPHDGAHLILPRPGLSADEALDAMLRAPQELEAEAGRWNEVDLTLPRFELRFTGMLTPVLKRVGLGELFERADLSGIAPSLAGASLGDVVQQAWMKVDEAGMKAAAVTAVSIVAASMARRDPPPPLVLVFDRPFALVVRDKSALFAAVVRDPSIRA